MQGGVALSYKHELAYTLQLPRNCNSQDTFRHLLNQYEVGVTKAQPIIQSAQIWRCAVSDVSMAFNLNRNRNLQRLLKET